LQRLFAQPIYVTWARPFAGHERSPNVFYPWVLIYHIPLFPCCVRFAKGAVKSSRRAPPEPGHGTPRYSIRFSKPSRPWRHLPSLLASPIRPCQARLQASADADVPACRCHAARVDRTASHRSCRRSLSSLYTCTPARQRHAHAVTQISMPHTSLRRRRPSRSSSSLSRSHGRDGGATRRDGTGTARRCGSSDVRRGGRCCLPGRPAGVFVRRQAGGVVGRRRLGGLGARQFVYRRIDRGRVRDSEGIEAGLVEQQALPRVPESMRQRTNFQCFISQARVDTMRFFGADHHLHAGEPNKTELRLPLLL